MNFGGVLRFPGHTYSVYSCSRGQKYEMFELQKVYEPVCTVIMFV